MSRYDVLLTHQPPASSPTPAGGLPTDPVPPPPVTPPAPEPPVSSSEPPAPLAPVDQPSTQSTGQSTAPPIRLPTTSGASGLVPRPKAFYITLRLDARLDQAVSYFQTVHGIKKADRSAIVNALLDRDELWTDSALDGLAAEVIKRLTSRLTK